MAANHLLPSSMLLILLLLYLPETPHAQQSYVNNRQLDCNQNYTTTLGFVCNAPAASCHAYITFRSTPTYSSPVAIAYLLSTDASQIAAINNISAVDPLPEDTLVIVPVNCTCSGRTYYQHNASYVLQRNSETYFTVANNTYQALSTCQSMEAQNPYNFRALLPNMTLNVPLRCACPTPNQTAAGFNYLLTYLVRQGNSYQSIANIFSSAGATVQGILDANDLTADQLIFFFTPLLVPVTREPTSENINTAALPPQAPPSPPTIPSTPVDQGGGSSSRRLIYVGVGVGAAVFVLFSLGILIWFILRRRRLQKPPPKLLPPAEKDSGKETSSATLPFSEWSISSEGIRRAIETLTLYKFEELEKATDSFSEANRIGGSSVYLGSFNGDYAAVKIMKGDVSSEIDVLRQINHSHIVRLSGFCLHQGITYLIYEYAQNGSLTGWLNPSGSTKDKDSGLIRENRGLDWKQRVQIAYDVADALNYLHNFTNPPYIHKNLKSSNVLLDSNLRAKVSNFGLARSLENEDDDQGGALTRHVVGTYGYMAPEYIENGLVTPKLDVFALGVVILELLSGKEPVMNGKGGELLCESIEGVMSGENVREKLRDFIDSWLGEDYPLDLAHSMAELAKKCVAHDLNVRPNVSEVVMALSKLLSSSLDWDPSLEQRSTSFSRSY